MNLSSCPKCRETDHVRRKLVAVSPDINSWAEPGLPGQKHLIINPPDGGRGTFLNGFYCDTCRIGFVSKAILAEVGLTEGDILDLEIAFTDTDGPDPARGYYGPRLGKTTQPNPNA
ncbi:MAG: hypothetical protein P4L99_00485 [Chthoniobacter sp.]|nr:hypothetical protein [Chthoniobacter sp.]